MSHRDDPNSRGNHKSGVLPGYEDVDGKWQESPQDVRLQIEEFIREAKQADFSRPHVIRRGEQLRLHPGCRLRLEDGTVLDVLSHTPPDLPLGYHQLESDTQGAKTLIVAPMHCYLPPNMQQWGWSAQLYSVRSQHSWGIGDFTSLVQLGEWAAIQGAGFVLLNPLVADTPALPQEPSPYSPSSRCFQNLLYLAVEDVPGANARTPSAKH